MASSSRSQPKSKAPAPGRLRKLEPISIAELESDSTMVGFTSLFRIPTTELALPHLVQPTPTPPPTEGVELKPTVGVEVNPLNQRNETIDPAGGIGPAPTVVSTPTVGVRQTPHLLAGALWQSEEGQLFAGKRARPIQRAQDALTHVEETVYDILWGTKNQAPERDRLTRIGYDRLAGLARINEKSVRGIIPRLVQKGFIAIASPADPNRRLGTEYRVLSYTAVLDDQRRRGRQWVLRAGNGVFYVRPVNASLSATTVGFGSHSAVGVSSTPTEGVGTSPSVGSAPSVGTRPTATVGTAPTGTVGAVPTVSLDIGLGSFRQTSSAEQAIYAALSDYGSVDDDAVRSLTSRCRRYASDASVDEIIHFLREKGKVVKTGRIENPIAFLLVYVPKCFAGDGIKLLRENREKAARARWTAQQEAEQWDRFERERLTKLLEDPSTSEEERSWARRYLELK